MTRANDQALARGAPQHINTPVTTLAHSELKASSFSHCNASATSRSVADRRLGDVMRSKAANASTTWSLLGIPAPSEVPRLQPQGGTTIVFEWRFSSTIGVDANRGSAPVGCRRDASAVLSGVSGSPGQRCNPDTP